MADDDHTSHREHLRSALLSSSNQFDSAVLTLSSGLLALSLAFIKDLVPNQPLSTPTVLLWSWVALSAAVVSTVSSFLTSQAAIRAQLDEKDHRFDCWAKVTTVLNTISAIAFIAGIVLTVVFVWKNVAP